MPRDDCSEPEEVGGNLPTPREPGVRMVLITQ